MRGTASARVLWAGAAVATAALLGGCAGAPGSATDGTGAPVSSASAVPLAVDELAEGDQAAPVDVGVDGPVQVNYRRITIPPGGGTGLHCHYGQLIAVVAEGALTHYAPIYPGGVHVYETGDSIIEGSEYVHEGRNEGDEDVVLWVTYVTPEGRPLAETDLDNCAH